MIQYASRIKPTKGKDNMSIWNKIVLGAKFMFGGFESATDYLLGLLNSFLGKEGVAGKLQKTVEFVSTIVKYMKKYEKYCPAIWSADYVKLMSVVQVLVDVFEDGKVDSAEIQKAIDEVKSAIDDWMK